MKDFLSQIILGNSVEKYILFFIIIIIGLLFKNIITKNFGSLIIKLTKQKKDEQISNKIESLIKKPMNLFVMMLIIYFAAEQINFPDEWGLNKILNKAFSMIFIYSIFWILIRIIDFIGFILKRKAEKTENKIDDQLIPFAVDAIKVVIVIFGLITILGKVFGVNVTALAAGLGVGGIAIAMASKESLENLLGSFTIFLDKPFTVGDVVNVGTITGEVEKVGFRSTRLRTFDKSLVTVPNKKMIDAELNNLGLRPVRRAKFSIGLIYETNIDQIKNIVSDLQNYLDNHDKTNEEAKVRFMEFGSSSLDIMVVYYVKNPSWNEFIDIKEEINFEIMRIVKKHNSDFAFPTTTVNLNNGN